MKNNELLKEAIELLEFYSGLYCKHGVGLHAKKLENCDMKTCKRASEFFKKVKS